MDPAQPRAVLSKSNTRSSFEHTSPAQRFKCQPSGQPSELDCCRVHWHWQALFCVISSTLTISHSACAQTRVLLEPAAQHSVRWRLKDPTMFDMGAFRSRKWSCCSTVAKLVGSLPGRTILVQEGDWSFACRSSAAAPLTLVKALADPEFRRPMIFEQAVYKLALKLGRLRLVHKGWHLSVAQSC